MKTTKQGVRDLGSNRPKPVEIPPNCTHPRMAECCPGCGHWSCPDCDLSWDQGAEGGGPFFR